MCMKDDKIGKFSLQIGIEQKEISDIKKPAT
jgi:hypothetical protein